MSHRPTLGPAVQAILEQLPDPGGHDASAPMLPPECYTSAEFFAFERDHVFTRSWICIGHEH